MNPRRSFVRKIFYLGAIALLLIPLFWLSQPGTPTTKKGSGAPGGQLARLRTQHQLSEAQLGEIDPTSETIKLATLGLRGVATVFLWEKANDYKMKKDWTSLSATLNQLSRLEPHFISVWRHQGWNLAYNVSAEFDNYRDRYTWVMKGIDFLQQGMRYNRREPKLAWDVGGFVSQKIGRADEAEQFRRLFKADDDFHGSRPLSERDNWLVGKEWYAKAEKLVEDGAVLGNINPAVFYSKRPLCQIDYADSLEKDGIFEEKTRRAWKGACDQWDEFGARDINWMPGDTFRLFDIEQVRVEKKRLKEELDTLEPGLRAKLAQQRQEALSPKEREALAIPYEKRSSEQMLTAIQAQGKLDVTDRDVARRISGPMQKRADDIVKQIGDLTRREGQLENARMIVSFESWWRRVRFEQDPAALAARQFMYEGNQAFRKADLIGARDAYDKGWLKWRELLDKPEFKSFASDNNLGEDLVAMYNRYRVVLEKRDEPFPKNFILADVVEPHIKRMEAERQLQQRRSKSIGGM